MTIVALELDFRAPPLVHSKLPDLHQCKLEHTFGLINDARWALESLRKACGLAAVKIRSGRHVLMFELRIDSPSRATLLLFCKWNWTLFHNGSAVLDESDTQRNL